MWQVKAILCWCPVLLGPMACSTVHAGEALGRVEVVRYASGATKQRVPYNLDGKRHGDMESYYPDGKIERSVPYVNGTVSGVVREWYNSGKTRFTGAFQDKVPRGVHSEFTAAGAPSMLTVYSQDGTTLLKSGFDERGKVAYSAGFKNDKPWAGSVLELVTPTDLKAIKGADMALLAKDSAFLVVGYKDGVRVSATRLPQVALADATENADHLYRTLVVEVAADFEGASLDEVVEMVVMASGYQGAIDLKSVARKASIAPITIPASKAPFIQIVSFAAHQIGCVVVLEGDGLRILDGG